jgi:hypothetical protein
MDVKNVRQKWKFKMYAKNVHYEDPLLNTIIEHVQPMYTKNILHKWALKIDAKNVHM